MIPTRAVQMAAIGREATLAGSFQRAFDDRVFAALDIKGEAVIHLWALRAGFLSPMSGCGGHIQPRQGFGRASDGRIQRFDARAKGVKEFKLHRQGALARLGDFRLQLAQLWRGEAHGVRHGLAVDKGGVAHQGVGVFRTHLDEIAQHIVVFDFQRADAGLLGVGRLQTRHHAARFISQSARFIERRGPARRDEAAITRQKRRFRHQRLMGFLH